MATVTKTRYRGIAIPHPRVLTSAALWASASSYDQANPVPGVPADQDGSAMVVKASGTTQTAGSELRLRNQIGGMPGHGYTAGQGWPATSIWQRNGDSDWLGWDSPTSVSGFEVIQHHVSGNDDAYLSSALLALSSGNVLAVACGSTASGGSLDARLYTTSTNAWGTAVEITTYETSGGDIPNLLGDLVQLPSGRVICVHLAQDDLEVGEATLATQYSDDDGATWATLSPFAMQDPDTDSFTVTDYTFRRVRCAYSEASGEILCLVWATKASGTYPDHVWQFASRDGGATFQYVTLIDGDDDDDQSLTGDIVVHGGVFVVLHDHPTATAGVKGSHAIRLGSAYDAMTAGTSATVFRNSFTTATTVGENRVCGCVDGRGVIWYYTPNTDPSVDNSMVCFSQDGGLSWAIAMGGSDNTGAGSWFQPGVTTVYPTQMACAWQRGRVIMLSNHDSPTTSTDDNSLTAFYLGGFSGVTLPYRKTQLSTLLRAGRDPGTQVGWQLTYAPFELPQNDGFTSNGGGTAAITASVLSVSSVGSANRWFSVAPSTLAVGDAFLQHCIMQANTDEGLSQALYDDGTNDYRASVYLSPTGIRLYDNAAAANLGTDTHAGGVVEWILAITGDAAVCWWRDWSSSEERTWTKLSGTLTDGGAPDGNSRFAFGTQSTSTSDVDVYLYAHSYGDPAGQGLASFANPGSLQGMPMGAGAEQAEYYGDGVSLYAVDGPAVPGEDVNIDTRYEYPIERIFPGTSPSPTHGWRSNTTTAAMVIAWRKSGGAFESRPYNGGVEVIHLRGINFRQAQLSKTTDNGSFWTDVAEIVNQTSVVFDRTGDVVFPSATGSLIDSPYFAHNELAGGYVEFPNGTVRKITANTGGNWAIGTPGNVIAKASIYCEDMDDTEDATGTAKVWHPNVTLLIEGADADGYRLQINDDATPIAPPEGYFTIGTMFFGSVLPFGRDYSDSRVITITPNVEMTTASDGTRRSRVRGGSRRSVALNFPATDVTPYSADGQPLATGSEGIQLWNAATVSYAANDEPVKLGGVMDYLRGPDRLMLYLPLLDTFTTSATLLTYGGGGVIYGRMVGGLTMTQICGVEGVSEVISVAGMRVDEEL